MMNATLIADKMRESSFLAKATRDEYSGGDYQSKKSEERNLRIRNHTFTCVNEELKKMVSLPTWHFTIDNMLGNLEMFNTLWYYPNVTKQSRARTAIKELKVLGVLLSTETTGLYIVNPAYIAKGAAIRCAEYTKRAIRDNANRTTLDLVKSLLYYAKEYGDQDLMAEMQRNEVKDYKAKGKLHRL